jgi:hypothetical protein
MQSEKEQVEGLRHSIKSFLKEKIGDKDEFTIRDLKYACFTSLPQKQKEAISFLISSSYRSPHGNSEGKEFRPALDHLSVKTYRFEDKAVEVLSTLIKDHSRISSRKTIQKKPLKTSLLEE